MLVCVIWFVQPIKDSLFRGSCTCNIPTERAYNAAEAAFKALQREEVREILILIGPVKCRLFLSPRGARRRGPEATAQPLSAACWSFLRSCAVLIRTDNVDVAGKRWRYHGWRAIKHKDAIQPAGWH